MRISYFLCLFSLLALSNLHLGCDADDDIIDPMPQDTTIYTFLPENLVAINTDQNISAQYTNPTTRYGHGVMGDQIEGGGLLVTKADKNYFVLLEEAFVFEDLQPRLADVDLDGELEIITIRTALSQGASVAIYKIVNEELVLWAESNFIGTTNRWLNIAAVADLDGDGLVEIAWVQTPHIGGILRIFRVENRRLNFVDELAGVSNHKLFSRNLCLSVRTEDSGAQRIYLPTDSFEEVVEFEFMDNRIKAISRMERTVDTSIPLKEQLSLPGTTLDVSCIIAR